MKLKLSNNKNILLDLSCEDLFHLVTKAAVELRIKYNIYSDQLIAAEFEEEYRCKWIMNTNSVTGLYQLEYILFDTPADKILFLLKFST